MNVASVGLARPAAARQAVRHHRRAERGAPAAGLRHRRDPRAGLGGDRHGHGKGRGRRTDEGLELIARLWTEDSVDFDGEFYRYAGARIEPKPVQKNLPLWLGGSSKPAIRRTARIGTGWVAGLETPAQVAPAIAGIKAALKETGRRIDADHYGASFHFRFGSWDEPLMQRMAETYAVRFQRDPKGGIVAGDSGDIMRRIEAFVAAGASKFVLWPIGGGDDDVLDQTRRLIAEVQPAVEALNRRVDAA